MERGSVLREEINRQSPRCMVAVVEKLEARSGRDCFLIWKATAKGILQHAGLWDVVDPDQNVDSHGVSPDEVSNEEFLQLKRALAWNFIQSAVAFEIRCRSDPRECWIHLQKRFAPNTAVQRYEYLRRLWYLRMQEDEKVLEFFSRVQHVLDHLRDMGEVADEKLTVLLLIDALPWHWRIAAAAYRREAEFGPTLQTTGELFTRMSLDEIYG